MHIGPLGSTIHVLRADAGTVAELATIDWNRWFRQVCLDPVRGTISLMTPSRLHGDLAAILDDIVDAAGSAVTGASKGLRDTRLRGPGDPPGTGMEPDCAFYLGERARAYRAALVEGEAAADRFFERTAPDLVVEVEITHADEGKVERYGDMGVRELWRLHGRTGSRELRVELLALRPGDATPPARRIAPARRPDGRRHPGSGGRRAVRGNPERAQRGCRPHRTPPPRRHPRARSGRRPGRGGVVS